MASFKEPRTAVVPVTRPPEVTSRPSSSFAPAYIYDLHGREVGVVRQKLLQLMPTYEIEVDGQKLGEIKKQFNLLKKNFDVNYLGLRVDGDFFGWNYSVFQDENLIMTISKEIVSLGDAYMMEFSDPDIEIYGLMLVVAIDAALFKERRNNLWS